MFDRRRALRAVGLFGLLTAVYFLTYSGQVVSTDELRLYDGTHSLYMNGTFDLAYTSSLVTAYTTLPGNAVVPTLDIEPMQTYLARPLLWLAAQIPGIGLVHMVWIFNILVTALTAIVVYYYGVALGYSDSAALGVALLFGLATFAWPYSRLFFREPLFTLFAFLCAYALERWRQGFKRSRFAMGWLIAAAATLFGAMQTKDAGVIIVPALILIVIPDRLYHLPWRRLIPLLAGIAILAALAGLAYLLTRGDILTLLGTGDINDAIHALAAYLLSPGFSLWTYSPVLLIGIVGAIILLRRRQIRQVVVPLTIYLAMAFGYSLVRGVIWYSGAGWGPRYLLPSAPFLALWLLPVADVILARRMSRGAQAAMIGLIVQSVFIQIVGVTTPVKAFGNYLYFEGVALNRVIIPWQDGVWNPMYLQPVVSAHQYSLPSPVAWIANGSGLLVIPLCLLSAGIAVFVGWRLVRPSWRQFGLGCGAVALSFMIMIYGGLRSYYHDPSYDGNNPVLWNVLDKLNAGLRPGDAILLNDNTYRNFFMNYYKGREPVYAMPDAPGERLLPPNPAEIESRYPEEQAHRYSTLLLSRLALSSSRWWFLTEFTPFSQDRLRPTERYLIRHYFPVGHEVVGEATARLLLFAPIDAPPDSVPPWPANPVNADYGAATLVGFDLPHGTEVNPGSILPVSLLWRHDGWPGDVPLFDYSVNVSLISQDGTTVTQRAEQPGGTFAPMSSWIPGGYYRDNHALEIPSGIPPGDYELWVLIFNWDNHANLPVRNAASGTPHDHVVIATIHVSA